MITYRKARPEDRAKYIDFANMVFSMNWAPHNFKTLLPKVYGDGRATDDMQNIAMDEAGNVRGLIAVMPDRMHVFDKVLNTGYVGTVSVHPFSRGEGHMKALMKMAVEGARAEGVDLMMLGGQRQRYEYFGFTPGGVAVDYRIIPANVRHALRTVDAEGIEFLPMENAAEALVDQAFALHEAQILHMERSREDFVCILKSWYAQPFIVCVGGAFAGYLLASRELKEIKELKLTDTDLYQAVLKAWIEQKQAHPLSVVAAGWDVELNRALSAFAEEESVENAEQLLVLNWAKVLAALLPLSGVSQPLQDGSLSVWIDEKPITVTVRAGAVEVKSEARLDAPHLTGKEAQRRLFAPLAAFEAPLAPAGWLPLRLYMSTADHF